MLWRNKQPIKPGIHGRTPSLDSLRRKLRLWNCQLKIYSTSAGNILWDAFYHHYLASLMQMCARFCFESYKKYPNPSVCLLPFVLHCLSKTTNCCLLNFTRNFWQERMVPEKCIKWDGKYMYLHSAHPWKTNYPVQNCDFIFTRFKIISGHLFFLQKAYFYAGLECPLGKGKAIFTL